MGCLIYYMKTDGKHPFGEELVRRQMSILDGKYEWVWKLFACYIYNSQPARCFGDEIGRPSAYFVVVRTR